MESKTIIVCVLLAMLGILSFVAGFAAEATKVKKSQTMVVYYTMKPKCEYPSSTLSVGLAIAAVLALEISRGIIFSTSDGYRPCFQTIANLPEIARICNVISWITSTVAFILFVWGIILSRRKGVERTIDGEYYCYTLRPNIFLGASVMALVSVLLAMVYYLFYVTSQKGATNTSGVEQELEDSQTTDGKKTSTPLQ